MTEPVFSIITVTKNNASGLRLTAKSIAVQQQPCTFEWIVIDGASTDNTADIIAEYATEHTIFISEPDNNKYEALNKGIDRAKGRYLWFIDAGNCLSDAYILRDLAKQIQMNLAPDSIYGDARENGRIKKANSAHRFVWGQITHPQSMIYRRPVVHNLRFDPAYPLSADYAFSLHILARTQRFFYYARFLCDYTTKGNDAKKRKAIALENYQIRKDLLAMPNFKNKLILTMNNITNFLQQKLPFVYRLIRTSAR